MQAGRPAAGDRRSAAAGPRRRRRQGGQGGGRAAARGRTPKSSPSAAKTDDGIFKVHRITEGNRDTLFYEIPKNELDKDFLWNTQLKKTTIGAGYGGQSVGSRVVRWVLKGDRVLLQNIDYTLVADPTNPLKDEANLPAIIRTFDVAAYAPNGDPVIDVTRALHDATCRSSRRAARVGGRGHGCDPHVPREGRVVSAEHQRRSDRDVHHDAGRGRGADAGGGRGGGRGGGGRGPSATVLVHHSMIKLPEKPMMPRLFDERVGYFTQGLTDYGTGEQQQMQKRFITRYRLEKKDPNAAISEPVKPIMYWVDPATPKKWVPCVKEGHRVTGSRRSKWPASGRASSRRKRRRSRAIRTGAARTCATR